MKRRAFTLVELLVSITIMALLSSIALFALARVNESAKRDKTIATISKLNSLIMAKYESYRTRRLPITAFGAEPFSDTNGDGKYEFGEPFTDLNGNGKRDVYPVVCPIAQGISIASYRVDAMRDFIRMEMPERFSDIDMPPITKTIIGGSIVIAPPALQVKYQAAIPAFAARNPNSEISESAKCLYLIITKAIDDPDAISQFSDDEIAIDPTDKMRYFVDGWGNQILFLRWGPGFTSPLQSDPTNAASHDPFDPMGVYKTAATPGGDAIHFYDPKFPTGNKPPLYPLIYSSAGASMAFDSLGRAISPTEVNAVAGINYQNVNNDPYWSVENPPAAGSWLDTNQDGNDDRVNIITNHDLSQ